MTAPISTPILPPDGAVAVLGGLSKVDIKQSDIGSDSGFGKLLGEALSGISEATPIDAGMAEQAENLVGQLQSLPQGGKLLPLLTQIMDETVANGGDPEQIFSQLNTSLEQLSADSESVSVDAVAAALYQVIEANPENFGDGKHQQLSAKQLLEDIWQQLTGKGSSRPGLAEAERVVPDVSLRALDKLSVQNPALSATPPGQAQAELAAALHTIRRLASGQSAGPDALSKSEAVAGSPAGAGAASAMATLTPATASGTPALTLGVPLHQANWDQALGERIQWLLGQGSQGAQIKLNPAHLGPMEVRIQMQNDQANIQFTATHAVVREALEAALPRLREMLGASGVELVNVDVSGESFAEQQRTGEDRSAGSWGGGGPEVAESHETVIETSLISVPEAGRLDLFV
jgi:flagellar hook-length control protein FliK